MRLVLMSFKVSINFEAGVARFSRFIYLSGVGLIALAFLMIFPLFVALYDQSFIIASSFGGAILITSLIGGSFTLGFRFTYSKFDRDMMVLLPVILFVILSMFGALPFFIALEDATFIQALYESVSMLTTSGSSVLIMEGHDTSRVFDLWRALLAWTGGIIAIVLVLAVLAPSHIGGYHLHVSGLVLEHGEKSNKMLRSAFKAILPVYLMITLVIVVVYSLLGFSLLTAFQLGAGLVSLTGLPLRDMPALQESGYLYLALPFLLVAGLNWDMITAKFRRHQVRLFADMEIKNLAVTCGILILFGWIFFTLFGEFDFLLVFFSVLSGLFGLGWLSAPISDLALSLYLIGAALLGVAAYSASGGLKQLRLLILLKSTGQELKTLSHPNAIMRTKVGQVPVSRKDTDSLWLLVSLFLLTVILATIALLILGLDFTSAFLNVLSHIALAAPLVDAAGSAVKSPNLLFDSELLVCAFVLIVGRVEATFFLIFLGRRFWLG